MWQPWLFNNFTQFLLIITLDLNFLLFLLFLDFNFVLLLFLLFLFRRLNFLFFFLWRALLYLLFLWRLFFDFILLKTILLLLVKRCSCFNGRIRNLLDGSRRLKFVISFFLEVLMILVFFDFSFWGGFTFLLLTRDFLLLLILILFQNLLFLHCIRLRFVLCWLHLFLNLLWYSF